MSAPRPPLEMRESLPPPPVIGSSCTSLTSGCLLTFAGHHDKVIVLGSLLLFVSSLAAQLCAMNPRHPQAGVKPEALTGYLSKSLSKWRCHLDPGRRFDLPEPQCLICKTRMMLSKMACRITGGSNLQNTWPCVWLHA